MRVLGFLLKATRPSQWVKNLFVVAPVLFAKAHTAQDLGLVLRALLGAVVFVLLSSAVYLFNDILDLPRDRLHPVKRHRPIASGSLPVRTAAFASGAILVGGVYVGWILGPLFLTTASLYVVLNIAYSMRLKEVAYLDVLLISTGFLLRILAGCFAIELAVSEISYFLVACTFLVALYLALGKRRAEMDVENGVASRAVLERYRRPHLDLAMAVVAFLTVITYAYYTVSPRTVEYFGTYRLVWTLPFVVIGIARFWWLTRRVNQGRSPTDVMVRDRWFLANIAAWAAVATWAIYGR